MQTKAVRIHGKDDLRLETFELPEPREDEILAKVVSDSICMSSYKAAHQADTHKRVPRNIAEIPVIIGHEFAGEIITVGKKWQGQFKPGDKFSIQPAINYEGGPAGLYSAPGYSYPYAGGDATYIIIPNEVMEHTHPGSYVHSMEIKQGGKMALLAGVGPMGLAAINYALHRDDRRPSLMVVTDINQERLDRAATLYTVEFAASRGIDLRYINTGGVEDPTALLMEISGGTGYDDVFCFAPVAPVVEQADDILAFDGCLNFFAGPSKAPFKAPFNFYDVHYNQSHVVGTSGGNNDDMKEALVMLSAGLDPAGLVTHIGGLNAVIDTTLNLPSIPGGKKLIYTHIEMPLTAIADFAEKGKTSPVFARLADICAAHNGLWSVEAEKYLLAHANEL